MNHLEIRIENEMVKLANKQRQLGNVCYFLYTKECKELEKTKNPCLKGNYNHCKDYHKLILEKQK